MMQRNRLEVMGYLSAKPSVHYPSLVARLAGAKAPA